MGRGPEAVEGVSAPCLCPEHRAWFLQEGTWLVSASSVLVPKLHGGMVSGDEPACSQCWGSLSGVRASSWGRPETGAVDNGGGGGRSYKPMSLGMSRALSDVERHPVTPTPTSCNDQRCLPMLPNVSWGAEYP